MIALLVLHSHQKRGSCFMEPLLAYCLYLACPFFMRAKCKQGENTPGGLFSPTRPMKTGSGGASLASKHRDPRFRHAQNPLFEKEQVQDASAPKKRLPLLGASFLVRAKGLEPSQPCDHKNLNLTRLPIPPSPHPALRCGFAT